MGTAAPAVPGVRGGQPAGEAEVTGDDVPVPGDQRPDLRSGGRERPGHVDALREVERDSGVGAATAGPWPAPRAPGRPPTRTVRRGRPRSHGVWPNERVPVPVQWGRFLPKHTTAVNIRDRPAAPRHRRHHQRNAKLQLTGALADAERVAGLYALIEYRRPRQRPPVERPRDV